MIEAAPLHIFLATTNRGKLRDFSLGAEDGNAGGPPVTWQLLPGLEAIAAPHEDRDSFEGNARLKAEYYSALAPGLLVLADDSGLEVHALEGRPGVRSARFALDLGIAVDDGGVDAANNDALLLEMTEVTDRTGRYRCVLALARDGVTVCTADGALEGELLTEPEGSAGFGYDPLFYVPELGCTMAQASPDQRRLVSHRTRALRKLLALLPHLAH